MSSLGFAIPKDVLENLRCSICQLYLSVSPIVIDSRNNQLVCGRCSSSCNSTEAKVFESILSLVLFPCRYVKHGCPENGLSSEKVEGHENSCAYCPFECITASITNCIWQGTPKNCYKHFMLAHPDMIVATDKIKISLQEDEPKLFIKVIDNNIYIINVIGNVSEKIIRFMVQKLIVDRSIDSCMEYEIEFSDTTGTQSMKIKNDIISHGKADLQLFKKVNFEDLKSMMGVTDLACTIEIKKFIKVAQLEDISPEDKTESEASNLQGSSTEILDELKCSNCTKYMKPPIFVCAKGHSLCNTCGTTRYYCSFCQAKLEGTRNIILEKIANTIIYPCDNKSGGCPFTGTVDRIVKHEKNCSYPSSASAASVVCPLAKSSACQWHGYLGEQILHLKNQHGSGDWITTNQMVYHAMDHKTSYNILQDGENLFRVTFFNSEKGLMWKFHHVGLKNDQLSPYVVEVQFLVMHKKFMTRFLKSGIVCYGTTELKDDLYKNSINMPLFLMRHYIKDGRLIVKYIVRETEPLSGTITNFNKNK